MEIKSQMHLAKVALKNGDLSEARRILEAVVTRERDNADAWQMLFFTLENPVEKLDCLKQVVRIKPNDERARKKMRKYRAGAEYRESKAAVHAAKELDKENEANVRKRKKLLGNFFSLIKTIGEVFFSPWKR